LEFQNKILKRSNTAKELKRKTYPVISRVRDTLGRRIAYRVWSDFHELFVVNEGFRLDNPSRTPDRLN